MKEQLLKLTMGLSLMVLAADRLVAQDAQRCASRQAVLTHLSESFGETRQSIGLGANNAVVEVFASQSGSWTITVTLPNGMTCLVANGEAFEQLAEALPAQGNDA